MSGVQKALERALLHYCERLASLTCEQIAAALDAPANDGNREAGALPPLVMACASEIDPPEESELQLRLMRALAYAGRALPIEALQAKTTEPPHAIRAALSALLAQGRIKQRRLDGELRYEVQWRPPRRRMSK